jgi:hypothetical protein
MCFDNGYTIRREITPTSASHSCTKYPLIKIPRRLRPWHQFRPFENDDQLNQLIRWVAGCLGLANVELPTVRWPEPLEFRPSLADRLKEWPAIVELLAGHSRERILLFEGPSGLGKSALIRLAAAYAKGLGVPVVQLDLKGGGLDVEGILGQFYLDLGQRLRTFLGRGRAKLFCCARICVVFGNLFWPFLTLTKVVSGTNPSWIG